MRKRTLILASLLLATAGVLPAQNIEVELGYRFLDISGSEAMYRSQINEQEGFLLRAFTLQSAGEAAFSDRYRVDAVDLGASPSGALRLEAEREGSYLLRIGYRAVDAYSALPGFANPLLSSGIVPGQHTFDRSNLGFEADLEFRPGRKFTPFVGYSYHNSTGPARSTYFLGQDEFRIASDLDDTEQEFRLGALFNNGRFNGQITGGWRDFSGSETFSLDAGEASGNNTLPILGREITISSFSRQSQVDASAPFTNAFVVGELTPRIRLVGSFVYQSVEADGLEDELGTGNFVSFGLSSFFQNVQESVDSNAKNTGWRGELRGEFAVTDGIDLIAGYRMRNREQDGAAAIRALIADPISFGGVQQEDIDEVYDAETAIERNDDSFDIIVAARALGPFSLRAGYRQTQQDVTLIPDLSEIVIAGNDSGTFERTIDTIEASGQYGKAGFTAGLTLQFDRADEPIFRTDFENRDRVRFRAAYARPRFRIGATAEQIDRDNQVEPIAMDSQTRQYSADFSVVALPGLEFFASGAWFEVDHSIGFRSPQTLLMDTSVYAEDGTSYDAGMTWFKAPFAVYLSGGQFDNKGTTPFKIDRLRARFVWDFMASVGVAAEYGVDNYTEELETFGDYESDRIGLFLRFRR
jgi:hypothetical protein